MHMSRPTQPCTPPTNINEKSLLYYIDEKIQNKLSAHTDNTLKHTAFDNFNARPAHLVVHCGLVLLIQRLHDAVFSSSLPSFSERTTKYCFQCFVFL